MRRKSTRSLKGERGLIFLMGLRFLPEFQSLRSKAASQIVLRSLELFAQENRDVSLNDLARTPKMLGLPHISRADLLLAIDLLEKERYIETKRSRQRIRHIQLAEQGRELLSKQRAAFEELKNRAFSDLIEDITVNREDWHSAFVEVACEFFSRLGREYVAVFTQRSSPDDVVGRGALSSIARKVASRHGNVSAGELARRFEKLLREQDPDRAKFIWTIAHGFFSLAALGLGDRTSIPSREFVKDKHIFLDTNVLFHILVPGMVRHSSLKELLALFERLGARVAVSEITERELVHSIGHQIKIARGVDVERLQELSADGTDPLLIAIESEAGGDSSAIPRVIQNFGNLAASLRQSSDFHPVSDEWFAIAEETSETKAAAREVAATYSQMRSWPKPKPVALHDALMLLYVCRERNEGRDAIFLTLDGTLPYCRIAVLDKGPPACVTVDALVQWVAPDLIDEAASRTAADVFAAAMHERFIATDATITLDDWNVLDQLQIDCNNLPRQDLLDSAAYVKKLVLKYDPSTPEGQMQVAGELRKFIAQPERHYRKDMEKAAEDRQSFQKKLNLYGFWLRLLVSIVLFLVGILVSILLGEGETILARWRDGWAFLSLSAVLPLVSRSFWRSIPRLFHRR